MGRDFNDLITFNKHIYNTYAGDVAEQCALTPKTLYGSYLIDTIRMALPHTAQATPLLNQKIFKININNAFRMIDVISYSQFVLKQLQIDYKSYLKYVF